MSEHIQWYDSREAGIATLNNAAGSMISVLDTVLVTGFNTKSVTSINVASNVATAVVSGHGYPILNTNNFDLDVTFEGAATSSVNGRKQLTIVDANTVTFAAPGVADGAISGTITCKRSPLGWTKPHTGTNKAMYARSDVTATDMLLRILDDASASYPRDCRAFGVESATDVDTYADPFPTAAQLSGGLYWSKGANTTRAKNWWLCGDSKRFYLFVENTAATDNALYQTNHLVMGFGDVISFKAGDSYHCMIHGGGGVSSSNPRSPIAELMSIATSVAFSTTSPMALCRAHTGVAKSVGFKAFSAMDSGGSSCRWYPSTVDNGMIVLDSPALISEDLASHGSPFRGTLPGSLLVPHRNSDFPMTSHPEIFTATDGSGLKFVIAKHVYNSTSYSFMLTLVLNRAWG